MLTVSRVNLALAFLILGLVALPRETKSIAASSQGDTVRLVERYNLLLSRARRYVSLCEGQKLVRERRLEASETKLPVHTSSSVVTETQTPPIADYSDADIEELLSSEPYYVGRSISVQRRNIPLNEAFITIGVLADISVAVDNDVVGFTDLDIKDQPWDKALHDLVDSKGLAVVQEGSILRVGKVEKLRQERECIKTAIQSEENTAD